MKIGIISDSHDSVSATEQAVEAMRAGGCSFLIHAGDICSPFIARIISESGMAHAAVFGNNDGDRLALSRMLDITPAPRHITVGGRSIVIFHEPFINDYIDPSCVDLLVYGHTHRSHAEVRGGMLVLNPGTLSGILSDGRTFAIYDTETRKAVISEL